MNTKEEEAAMLRKVYESAKKLAIDPDYRVMLGYFHSKQIEALDKLGSNAGEIPPQQAIAGLAMLHSLAHLYEQTAEFVRLYEEGMSQSQKKVADSAM